MFKLSAKTRITFGLLTIQAAVLLSVIMLPQLWPELSRYLPDADQATRVGRARLCESVSVAGTTQITRNDLMGLKVLLQAISEHNHEILSVGVRRANGTLVAEIGDHAEHWEFQEGATSTDTHVQVPLYAGGQEKWGLVEFRFRPLRLEGWLGWLQNPGVVLVGAVTTLLSGLFYYFIGRTLKHLDPSKVVPGRVRSALDTLAEGLLMIDRQDRIVLANQAFMTIVGGAPEALIGRRASELPWVAEDRPSFPWSQAMADDVPQFNVMLQLRDTQDVVRTFIVNSTPIPGHDGKCRGVVTTFEDVTELQQNKLELSKSKEAAESANRAKSEFLARMSHEIRTPMNAILGYTDVLRRGFDANEDDRQDYLNTIHASGEHLLALINDILDLSKIESGRLELEWDRWSPHQLVDEAVAIFRVRAQDKGLMLEYRFEGPLPETIRTDAVRFRQVLMNLVGNSLKFTEQGGVWVILKLARVQGRPHLVLQVADSGIGIAPEARDKIFQPFSQADTSITRRFGGTGLGLAICRRLAQAFGGDIRVDSEVGKGTVFTVTLDPGPLDDVPLIEDWTPRKARHHAAKKDDLPCRLPPCRILVADDGESNRKLLQLVLSRAGATVEIAVNGQMALQMALQQPFDVILMDMQMPVLDGYAATLRLRQANYPLPIIALTAHAMTGDEQKCREAGCSHFLTKPVNIDKLIQTLAEILGPAPDEVSGVRCQGSEVRKQETGSAGGGAPAGKMPRRRAGQPDTAEAKPLAEARAAQPSRAAAPASDAGVPIYSRLPTADPEFREIVEEFLARLQTQMAAMQTAAEKKDYAELARLGHWLKGSGGTVGFDVFTDPACELEKAAKSGRASEIANALARVQDLAARAAVTAATPSH